MKTTQVAVDLAKSVFEIAVSREVGQVTEQRRLNRSGFRRFLETQAPSEILMEACGTAHYWGRVCRAMGHQVRLLPAGHVRRYRDGNKSDRKVRVERPRLRVKGRGEGGEVEMPAYEAMRRPGPVAERMLEILLAGVSTRRYADVIPAMADTVGVAKSSVSREAIEASETVLRELMERRLEAWDLLIVYVDGIQFGNHHVLAAVGVDNEGRKHVLGLREGASENAEVATALLEDLVQRCRNHKLRNLTGHLPRDQHAQVKSAFRAAVKLEASEGTQKLEQLALWLEREDTLAEVSIAG